MINTNETRYQIEQNEFFSDKCPKCMAYLNNDGECKNAPYCEFF